MRIRNGNSLIDDENEFHAFKWAGDFKEGSFDAVIGNPPYIRIQTLDEKNVDYFNSRYKAATKNYDIYALFVEKGLSLLKEGGVLGFILPSKFFNADYGAGLRKVIAENKALYKIVDFKDFQVFENATTYTCLLFLKKTKSKNFEYLELSNKDELNTSSRTLMKFQYKKSIQAQPSGEENWNFMGGNEGKLMNKFGKISLTLGDISKNIFQGLTTSADRVYLLRYLSETERNVKVFSKATEKDYILEKELMKKLLKGQEIRRWHLREIKYRVLFPYKIVNNQASLIDEKSISTSFPKIHDYLKDTKKLLESREEGKLKGSTEWFGYIYRKNLEKFEQPKIMTQVLASRNSFTFDEKGEYYFVGGGNAGGYGIVLKEEYSKDYHFVLGLLNSKLLEFYLKKISTPFRGGFYSYGKRFIEKLPIIIPSDKEKSKLAELAKKQLEKSKKLSEFGDKKTSESAKLEEEIKKTDNEIDELVHQLYGITEEEKKIIEESLR